MLKIKKCSSKTLPGFLRHKANKPRRFYCRYSKLKSVQAKPFLVFSDMKLINQEGFIADTQN
jgi:hypothetical protein